MAAARGDRISGPISMPPLHVVILAAGQGKRMHSALPKVLHRIAGRPLLSHVLDVARALSPERVYIVYGHGGAEVKAAFAGTAIEWVEQAKRLGTGHALMQALPLIPRSATVLVLNGDVPLVRKETLRKLVRSAGKGIAIATSDLSDASGYGRVVRDGKGRVLRIVEHKDATARERAIREWYAGFLAGNASRLAGWLAKVSNRNAQKEYYLRADLRVADVGKMIRLRSSADAACLHLDEIADVHVPVELRSRAQPGIGTDPATGADLGILEQRESEHLGVVRHGDIPQHAIRPDSDPGAELHAALENAVDVDRDVLPAGQVAAHVHAPQVGQRHA